MTRPGPAPIDARLMLERAATGLGKVDLWGRRGVTMLSIDEAEAMACLLASLGLVAVPPGQPIPETLFLTGETA